MKIKNDTSGIEFNLTESQNSWNIPVLSNGANKIGQNSIEYADQFGITPIFNAVEIDWNDADLATAVEDYIGSENFSESLPVNFINTTGDLLNVIAHLQAEVTILSNLVKGLYKALGTSDSNSE